MGWYPDMLGYTGGCILGFQLLPQIYKAWKTLSTGDVSWFFLLMNVAGLTCMAVYGFETADHALYFPALVSLFNTLVLSLSKFFIDNWGSSGILSRITSSSESTQV